MAASYQNNSNHIWLTILLFLFITDIQFSFFPLSSRKIIGIIGIVYFLKQRLKLRSKVFRYILGMYCILFFVCIISGANTGFIDYSFEMLLIARIIFLLGFVFIYKTWKHLSLNQFLTLFIYISIVNNCIALLGFLIPSVNAAIIAIDPIGDFVATKFEGLRFIGLGTYRYFEGGVVNILAIVSTFYLFSIKVFSLKRTCSLIGVLLVLGLFIARTTIFGLIGFIFLLSNEPTTRKRIWKLICICIITLPLFFIILDIIFHDNPTLHFAFELIYNIIDGKGIETESSNSLSYQYIFPDTLKTWLIGDGIWIFKNAYYMHTDVGYSRLIFFWGIIGCIAFLWSLLKIVGISTKHAPANAKLLGYLSILIIVILNAKGFTDISYYFVPIMFLIFRDSFRDSKRNEREKNLTHIQFISV